MLWAIHPAVLRELTLEAEAASNDEEIIFDEPIVYQNFDKPHQWEKLNFRFVNQLFDLLYDFNDYLNLLHEEYHTDVSELL